MAQMAESQIVCHECDLLTHVPGLESWQKAYCPCCGYLLVANRVHSQRVILSFSITALMFLALANAFPFMEFSAKGLAQEVTLVQSVAILITHNFPELAFVVFMLIIAIPAMLLLGFTYVTSAVLLGRRFPFVRLTLRATLQLLPWSMADIFLIGILVSYVKIVSLADDVAMKMSFWSYAIFTVCMVVVVMYVDKREMWRRVEVLTRA